MYLFHTHIICIYSRVCIYIYVYSVCINTTGSNAARTTTKIDMYDDKQAFDVPVLQHTATHCSTLQHTAAHCNTLQHIAAPQMRITRSAENIFCWSAEKIQIEHKIHACDATLLQYIETHCNVLQHTATYCNTAGASAARSAETICGWAG